MSTPSQRRLQRPPDFTGKQLDSFSEVAIRHGLPGALLGVICLSVPEMRSLLMGALTDCRAQPLIYLGLGLLLLLALNIYAWFIDKRWTPAKLGWILYLGGVSAWEEWVFRLAVPYFVESHGGSLVVAIVVTNLVFAAAHYFTLRWKWQWCLLAFFFGMALSRNLGIHFDLALIIGIHWVATFLNTPRAPGSAVRPSKSAATPIAD